MRKCRSMKPPAHIRKTTSSDRDEQPARWRLNENWKVILDHHPQLRVALEAEVAEDGAGQGSIRRRFVHNYANGDPVELFLIVMAWGFASTNARWPKQANMLLNPPRDRIKKIVEATQKNGAEAGWRALFEQRTHVEGLGAAFGTKLLYFAGFRSDSKPRPLTLDWNVRIALLDSGVGICSHPELWRSDYMDYLELAEDWAAQISTPGNEIESDVVEYALFNRGSCLLDTENARRKSRG
jgi:hypothetical protein